MTVQEPHDVATHIRAETFRAHAKESYARPIPKYVEREIRGYLGCGIFSRGLLRCHCAACGHDLLVAFSCKGRGFCPPRCGRRMANYAAQLTDRVIPAEPRRQYFLSLPLELRRLVAFRADVLRAIVRVFVGAVFDSHKARARAAGQPANLEQSGMMTRVARCGGSLNLSVHLPCAVLDGVFTRTEGRVLFHPSLPPTHAELMRVATRTAAGVEKSLRRKGDRDPSDEPPALDACADLAQSRCRHDVHRVR